jgi:hypothetical protein
LQSADLSLNSAHVTVALFAISAFVASALLFLVQPMCAKMILPCLGGAPNVWTTCMLFFQCALLAGYAYAYLGQTIGLRKFATLHLALTFFAVVVALRWKGLPCPRNAMEFPESWLLMTLSYSIGIPYLLLGSSAPLLQTYLAAMSDCPRNDPYPLYAASNAGSVCGLLGYPYCHRTAPSRSPKNIMVDRVLRFCGLACGLRNPRDSRNKVSTSHPAFRSAPLLSSDRQMDVPFFRPEQPNAQRYLAPQR